jgi:adenine deaminase
VAPGFIESHLHLEGLHLLPAQYAPQFLAHGTTTVITDLHEIANAGGMEGLRWYLSLIGRIPLDVYVMAPSCVPSSRFELGAGSIGPDELAGLKALPVVKGLGEVMDIEGVMARRPGVMEKIAVFEGRPIDGHAPGLTGEALDRYMSAGIYSDHETTGLHEGEEKLKRGMHLFLRQGSVAKDLPTLAGLIRPENLALLSLCTDDLSSRDLYDSGHLDRLVAYLVGTGISPFVALRLVTTNAACYFNLNDRNRLAVGKKADLVVFDDPAAMRVKMTVKNGAVVYRAGDDVHTDGAPAATVCTPLHVAAFTPEALRPRAEGSKVRVMGVADGSIITENLSAEAVIKDGRLMPDERLDTAYAYTFDRYRAEASFGVGFVAGFSIKNGALGSTYAHDSHNLIIVGDNIEDIYEVFCTLTACGGGMAACHGGEKAVLPMPHYGIISGLDAAAFLQKETELDRMVRRMGITLKNPFFQMSFLSLPVIPHLRLTTKGLLNVLTSTFVPVSYD